MRDPSLDISSCLLLRGLICGTLRDLCILSPSLRSLMKYSGKVPDGIAEQFIINNYCNMQKNILIFVVSYNAQRTIDEVLSRIPTSLFETDNYKCEVLVIDDCSKDATYDFTLSLQSRYHHLPLTVLQNPTTLGYGGNQKTGYQYAIENDFDIVVLLHGDGQYAPEELPRLLEPLVAGECDAVFGSRMLTRGSALRGGMPLYKYFGNQILTRMQNALIRSNLSEYHSGYRLYSVSALKRIPFDLNSSDFDFDTEIIIQLLASGAKIKELPIPTFYGDEVCHVNGFKYAAQILLTSIKYRLQSLSVFYDPKFDIISADSSNYQPKFNFPSSHRLGLDQVAMHKNVLVLGSGNWSLVGPLVKTGANIYVIDRAIDGETRLHCSGWIEGDLDELPIEKAFPNISFDLILCLDVLEHLRAPQQVVRSLCGKRHLSQAKIVISCPNVAFFPVRIMLFLGFFNQGKRGILDATHLKHFTYYSLQRFLKQYGFKLTSCCGVPAPYPLALGDDSKLAKALLFMNQWLIGLLPNLFSYQTFCICEVVPLPSQLLSMSLTHSEAYVKKLIANQSRIDSTADL